MPASTFAGSINEKIVPTGTAEALHTGASITATDGVLVSAPSSNTQSIYVGPSGVSVSNGTEITPGAAIFLPITNPANIFVVAAGDGQKARGLAV